MNVPRTSLFALLIAASCPMPLVRLGRFATLHAWSAQVTAAQLVRTLAFELFPWSLLVPFALADVIASRGCTPLFCLFIFGAVLGATALAACGGSWLAPVAVPIVLLLAIYLDRLLAEDRAEPLAAAAMVLSAIVVGHDLLLQPTLFGHHAGPAAGPLLFACAGLFGLVMAVALSLPRSRRMLLPIACWVGSVGVIAIARIRVR